MATKTDLFTIDIDNALMKFKSKIHDDLRKMFETLVKMNGNPDTDNCVKELDYVSFDAKTTASQYCKKAAQNAVTYATRRYGNMQLYKKYDVKSDLRLFINLFLKGGNNFPKILARAKPSVEVFIRMKCSAYDIVYRSARSTQDRGIKNLTLSKIVRAFSVHTAIEILITKSNGILQYSKLFKRELPLVMQHTIFPGLIPVSQLTEDIKAIAVILNMEIFLILGSTEKKEMMMDKTVGELIESSAKYVDEAIQSGIYDDAAKLKILAEAGVLNAKDNGEFELSAATIELMNELPAIKAVYTLKYPDAVRQLESN